VATHHPPIHISLKDPNQYPCRPNSLFQKLIKKGIKTIITKLLNQGLLIPINSPGNTPILPIKKAFWVL
jgi:hypothetical protein